MKIPLCTHLLYCFNKPLNLIQSSVSNKFFKWLQQSQYIQSYGRTSYLICCWTIVHVNNNIKYWTRRTYYRMSKIKDKTMLLFWHSSWVISHEWRKGRDNDYIGHILGNSGDNQALVTSCSFELLQLAIYEREAFFK